MAEQLKVFSSISKAVSQLASPVDLLANRTQGAQALLRGLDISCVYDKEPLAARYVNLRLALPGDETLIPVASSSAHLEAPVFVDNGESLSLSCELSNPAKNRMVRTYFYLQTPNTTGLKTGRFWTFDRQKVIDGVTDTDKSAAALAGVPVSVAVDWSTDPYADGYHNMPRIFRHNGYDYAAIWRNSKLITWSLNGGPVIPFSTTGATYPSASSSVGLVPGYYKGALYFADQNYIRRYVIDEQRWENASGDLNAYLSDYDTNICNTVFVDDDAVYVLKTAYNSSSYKNGILKFTHSGKFVAYTSLGTARTDRGVYADRWVLGKDAKDNEYFILLPFSSTATLRVIRKSDLNQVAYFYAPAASLQAESITGAYIGGGYVFIAYQKTNQSVNSFLLNLNDLSLVYVDDGNGPAGYFDYFGTVLDINEAGTAEDMRRFCFGAVTNESGGLLLPEEDVPSLQTAVLGELDAAGGTVYARAFGVEIV